MFRGQKSVGAMRALAAGAVAAATCAAFAATASAAKTNTFDGSCDNVPVHAVWAHPLTFTPEQNSFVAIGNGGTCSGSLNGQQIDGLPVRAEFTPSGIQSCGGANVQGPFRAEIAGETFYFSNTSERRIVGNSVIIAQADGSGQMVATVSGDPNTAGEFVAECSSTGATEANVTVDHMSFMNVVSPAHESSRNK